jgi:hypothetical protein
VRGADRMSVTRNSSLVNLCLAVGATLTTLALLEAGVRAYYAVAGVSPAVTLVSSGEEWKQAWLKRHREGLKTTDGIDQFHPLFGWSIKPNLRNHQEGDHPPVTTNAQGWRALRDYSYARRPGVLRIVVLGDSYTFGEYARDEDVWPVQLERQLDTAEVLNLGVRGYGTDQQLRVLEEEGMKYGPDIVVLGLFLEDVVRNALSFRDYAKPMFILRGGELVLTNSPVPPPEEILAQGQDETPKSYLLDFLRSRWTGDEAEVREEYKRYVARLTRAIHERMTSVTTSAGVKLLVVIIPSPRPVGGDIEPSLERWGDEVGYAVINARPALSAAERIAGLPTLRGFYLSAFGDFVLATAVRQSLVDRGWVSPPSEKTLDELDPIARYRMPTGTGSPNP